MFDSSWQVLLLFLIPIGGGIPGGVILAQNLGLTWIHTATLYLISDIILACFFEPTMLLFLHWSKKSPRAALLRAQIAHAFGQSANRFGFNPSPFALIMITFGTDPMTGRSIAKAAGHGFLSGWILTIIGDMIFFATVMVSTIYLNNILGNGTLAAVIVTAAIIGIPILIRRVREARRSAKNRRA